MLMTFVSNCWAYRNMQPLEDAITVTVGHVSFLLNFYSAFLIMISSILEPFHLPLLFCFSLLFYCSTFYSINLFMWVLNLLFLWKK